MNAAVKVSEEARLAALDSYDALDTPAEPSFDRITRITTNALDVPMAAVTLIDGHRQWLKSRQGPLALETCKSDSFCNVTIRLTDPLIVEDASTHPEFKDHPLVVGPPYIRFYAGAQLHTPDGFNLGSLCAVDLKPRKLSEGQIALLQDLAAMVMSEFEARKQARTDSLTGALARRGFRDEAERVIGLASRHRNPLSCIVMDVDHFKSVNDVHGHGVGDRILVEVVNVCRERLRGTDILGRIGGEEFAVVLPHTDAAKAMSIADDIRTTLEKRVIVLPGDSIKVTASFGVADGGNGAIALDELLRRADVALYAAKDAGRNTCIPWDALPHVAVGMRRVLKAGQIVFNAGRSAVDCTVRGLGDSEARLEVISTVGIPDQFKLAIAADNFSRGCMVKAKQGRSLEVAFV
jgi:diguanylate cyclase (GGDEF)-like protein